MVTPRKITPEAALFFGILPRATTKAFLRCSEINLFPRSGWYLAGGTALALQAGHRRSVDLDFFTKEKSFNEKKTEEIMNEHGDWVTNSISEGTLYGEFLGAKTSFITYPFFTPNEPMLKYGTISILAPLDIAAMKIIAISQCGKKRDFFDLYWICQNINPLNNIIARVAKQYSVSQNTIHILKSLVYFEDAESDPEPEINFDANWKKVKNFFIKEIPTIADKLIR